MIQNKSNSINQQLYKTKSLYFFTIYIARIFGKQTNFDKIIIVSIIFECSESHHKDRLLSGLQPPNFMQRGLESKDFWFR